MPTPSVLHRFGAYLLGLWRKRAPVVRDVAGRVIRTFLGTFAATYVASTVGPHIGSTTNAVDWSVLSRAAASGLTAAMSLIIGLVGTQTGDPTNAKLQFRRKAHKAPTAKARTDVPGAPPVVAVKSEPRPTGRRLHHDHRSRAYDIEQLDAVKTVGLVPAHVLHKRLCLPYDQGDLSSCTGNAMAGALMTEPLHQAGWNFGEDEALALYTRATHLDHFTGYYPKVDTGSSGLAVCKAAKEAGYLASYHHAFAWASVLKGLAVAPLIVGLPWYDDYDNPGPDGFVALTPGGRIRGGHEFELVGYDLAANVVHAVNSWGVHWGKNGGFSFSFDDAKTLLSQHGDATLPVAVAP